MFGLAGLCWAALCLLGQPDSWEIEVAAKSPLYLQSKLWAPASPYKLLHDHAADYQLDFVSLWKPPPTTDLTLWQALTQGETTQRNGLRQSSLRGERSCFSGEEVQTRTRLHVPD